VHENSRGKAKNFFLLDMNGRQDHDLNTNQTPAYSKNSAYISLGRVPKPGPPYGRLKLTFSSSIHGGCSDDEEVPESGSRARLREAE